MLSENEGTRPAILELIRNLKVPLLYHHYIVTVTMRRLWKMSISHLSSQSSAFLPGNVVVMIGVTEPESSHEQGECPKVKQRVSRIPLAVVPHKCQ
jgi:hypothetical protein